MPMWNKTSLQNSNSPTMEHLMFFHDHSMILISSILIFTLSTMIYSMKTPQFNQFMLESHEAEMFWTSIPALMLIFIALPSLKTLYMMEENLSSLISVKTLGLQWYWNYDYSNLSDKDKNTCSMTKSPKMRSEMTNKNLVIPCMTPTRMMISSKDVLHSWTIPSIGVKSDATPGRINQIMLTIKRPSVLIGQCSEICGAGHSFMPIYVESPTMKKFLG